MADRDWRTVVDAAVEARAAELVEVRRHLHAHPEPSGQEYESSGYVRAFLEARGFATELGADGRGVVAGMPETLPAPRIGLRADLDALRIWDQKEVDYRSQRPGVMHACGHDAHTATVIGALLGLQATEAAGAMPWPVSFRGVFQPAEETGEGALEMIRSGAIDGLEAMLSVHVDPSRPLGKIGVRYGALTAACDDLVITITGRGGHAARPHESLDPIAAAAQLITNMYLFVPRTTNAQDPVVITIGQIAAGENPNVIPEQAVLKGTLRTLGGATREQTKRHILQLARGLGETSGTKIDVEFRAGSPSVRNDAALTDLLRQAGTELLGGGSVEVIDRPSMGGEDFAFYLDHLPGAMFRLGCSSPSTRGAALHTPAFDIDERALVIGAKVLARAVVLWSDPARRAPPDGRSRQTGGTPKTEAQTA